MSLIQQSEATASHRRVLLYLVSSTDGKTPMTGLTFSGSQILISQNGAAPVAFAGTVTEIGNGLYYYTFASTELATLGFVSLTVIYTGVLQFVKECQVVAWDPFAMPTSVATQILQQDITSLQVGAAKASLLTAILKAVSQVARVGSTIVTYELDGATVKITQAITLNSGDQPIDSIGVGS
jgi:hypothetical protein